MKLLRRLVRFNDRLGLRGASQNIRSAVALIQMAGAAVLAVFLLVVVVSALNGALSAPGSADEILEAARSPRSFTFEAQSVRTLTSGEDVLETQAVRFGAVDLDAGKFQARLLNVFPQETLLSSDGTTTVGRQGDGPLQTLDAPIAVERMLPPQPQDILAASPRVISDTETVRGRRAWRLDFDLTPEIARKLFLADGLDLSGGEIDDLTAGRYTTDWAYVMVTRDQPSMLLLYTGFTIAEGASYRFLVKYSLFDLTEVSEITL